MVAYIILVFAVILCVIIQENTHRTTIVYNIYKIPLSSLIMFVVFVSFYSLRYNVGMDYLAYYYMTVYADGYWIPLVRGEWLSAAFIWVAYALDCPYVYFASVAIISFGLIMYSVSKYVEVENGLGWGMLAFMVMPIGFTASLSMMRQFIAIAIIMYCMKYIINRSKYKFLSGVFFAAGFHMSSIVAVCMWIVTAKRFKLKYFVLMFLAFIFMFFVLNEYIGALFPGFNQYLNTSYTEDNGGLQITSILQLLLYVFFAMVFLCFRKYLLCYKNFTVFLRCFLLGVVCSSAMFLIEPYNAFRFGGAMLYCLIFLMPYIFVLFARKSRFAVKILMWCSLTVLICFNLIGMAMKGHLHEYQFFFDL